MLVDPAMLCLKLAFVLSTNWYTPRKALARVIAASTSAETRDRGRDNKSLHAQILRTALDSNDPQAREVKESLGGQLRIPPWKLFQGLKLR
jgi:hypothetical protein